jgi:hypothetical protein
MVTAATQSPPTEAPRSATTIADEIARLDQALEDLDVSTATSVSLIHCPNATRERSLLRDLSQRARERRFVSAQVSLREHTLDTPSDLVRELLERLVPPGEAQPRGVLWLADLYLERHGRRTLERFDEAVAAEGADGDLTALCRAYLAAASDEMHGCVRAYEAWREGTEAPKKYRNPAVRHPLGERSAQRVLAELTRLLRAFGHRGFVVFLSEGDALAERTDRQREKGYTVLRELVDNFDGHEGTVATRVILSGTDPLFYGARSIRSLEPLRMRLSIPSDAEPPPPHRSWTTLVKEPYEWVHRAVRTPERGEAAMRNLIRISEGLPPTEAITSMSVGQERIDRTIERLFRHIDMAGSVFSVLVGEYGSGKTHLMMHLAERALNEQRPVFWLNLERTNLDLGHPPRHLSRLLEQSSLPLRRRPSARDLASRWTRFGAKARRLESALEEIASGDSEESAAALKALRLADDSEDRGHALEAFLSGADLEDKPGGANYRLDAYRRVLLWVELLGRLEGMNGAVVLVDEAENLYTSGRPWSERRTALRTLSFYCGGALPRTGVVMSMTPVVYEEMRKEAKKMLREADQMASTLAVEDVRIFRRRLDQLDPSPVPALGRSDRLELCERVRKTHRTVRGKVEVGDWSALAEQLVRQHRSPRTLVRHLVDELESAWWAGS